MSRYCDGPPKKRCKLKGQSTSSHLSRLIGLKVKCDFSVKQLKAILELYHPEEAEFLATMLRREFRDQKLARGCAYYRLHGCVTCDRFMWEIKETTPCPNCGNQDGRYGASGDPLQEVFYFPLLPRLEAMYRDPAWRETLEYPDKRPKMRDRTSRSDVFDGTAYKRLRRGVRCDHFIALSYCADAIPADKRIKRSILPGIINVQNYDPRIRCKNINMMLMMLLPPHITTTAARKFYTLLEDELNDLYEIGVANGRLKGGLLMMRSDQKGKEFDLGLRACTSYDGPCSVCELMAECGTPPFRQISVRGFRRYLQLNHPYRRDASFGPNELRQRPPLRSMDGTNDGGGWIYYCS